MKRITCLSLLILTFLLFSCGYRNPYIYSGPEKSIYITSWKNRTSELQLESLLYQSLTDWFQNNKSLTVVKTKEEADFILGGEIMVIDTKSIAHGSNNSTSELKLRLKVRYVLKDLKKDVVLYQNPGIRYPEVFSAGNSSSKERALQTILNELSQDIYKITLAKLSRLY